MEKFQLHVFGKYACFTRPEMKVERVSYDVITPSAARGMLESIHWKPAILWVVDKIYVLNPVKFRNIRRNEIGKKMNHKKSDLFIEDERQQRSSMILKDVSYVIEAHIELTNKAGERDSLIKHEEMFKRRALKGQCFNQPCLGCREFSAGFALIDKDYPFPQSLLTEEEKNRDLGYMLNDFIYTKDKKGKVIYTPTFFRAALVNGCVEVPRVSQEVCFA